MNVPAGDQILPFAPGSDSSTFFGELDSSSWSGVVSVAVPSGTITHIRAFSHPEASANPFFGDGSDSVYGGGFDGRWLVWSVSNYGSNDWQIWAWDSLTNRSALIATASLPIAEPVVSDGRAAWVQANQGGIGVVHLYTLATRQDQVLATHASAPAVFWGPDLIWQAVDVPPQSGHLVMVAAASGTAVAVPGPLASIHHLPISLAASTSLVAWTDGPDIWAFRQGDLSASRIDQLAGDSAGSLAIAGDLITWNSNQGPSAFDIRSSSVTNLTPVPGHGSQVASGQSLVISWPIGKGKPTPSPF
ncbi:MAG: hypothetical protein ACRENM_06420, partial [Candidatus Dormibacteraceae bacterium]